MNTPFHVCYQYMVTGPDLGSHFRLHGEIVVEARTTQLLIPRSSKFVVNSNVNSLKGKLSVEIPFDVVGIAMP